MTTTPEQFEILLQMSERKSSAYVHHFFFASYAGERVRQNPFPRFSSVSDSYYNGIPKAFLKSNYSTLSHINCCKQVYQEDRGIGFRARLGQIIDDVEKQIVRDYKMLVNETNRTNLSRYPFEDMVRTTVPPERQYSEADTKLDQIKQRSLTIPRYTNVFRTATAL